MARARLILLVSWICAGCAATPPPHVTDPGLPARPLRLLATEPGLMGRIGRSLVTAPPVDGRSLRSGPDDENCRRFRPAGSAERRVTAAEIVDAWETGLRTSDAAHGWLLQPVTGALEVSLGLGGQVAGLRVEDDLLVVCSVRQTPDWVERLEHPALWPMLSDPATGHDHGGGAFR